MRRVLGEYPSGSEFRSVPTSEGVAGNGGVWSTRETPKEMPSHPEKPGKGKTGRMTTSEPSMRHRNYEVARTMVDEDGDDGPGMPGVPESSARGRATGMMPRA